MQYRAQNEVKHLIRSEIALKNLERITITYSNKYKLKWKNVNSEFIFEGRLYDVVKMKISNDTVHYFCINDTREEELFAKQADLIKQNVNDSIAHNKTAQKLFQQLVQDYFFNKWELNLFAGIVYLHHAILCSDYYSCVFDIPSPPPKVS